MPVMLWKPSEKEPSTALKFLPLRPSDIKEKASADRLFHARAITLDSLDHGFVPDGVRRKRGLVSVPQIKPIGMGSP